MRTLFTLPVLLGLALISLTPTWALAGSAVACDVSLFHDLSEIRSRAALGHEKLKEQLFRQFIQGDLLKSIQGSTIKALVMATEGAAKGARQGVTQWTVDMAATNLIQPSRAFAPDQKLLFELLFTGAKDVAGAAVLSAGVEGTFAFSSEIKSNIANLASEFAPLFSQIHRFVSVKAGADVLVELHDNVGRFLESLDSLSKTQVNSAQISTVNEAVKVYFLSILAAKLGQACGG